MLIPEFDPSIIDNTITGDSTGNILTGTSLNDQILGLGGNDLVFGLDGSDWLIGDFGSDTLQGDNGNDLLEGNQGSDYLLGDQGHDILRGGEQGDGLSGGAGDDLLLGGLGSDTLEGGSGIDIFAFAPGDGRDFVLDFNDGVDLIGLSNGLTFADISIRNTKFPELRRLVAHGEVLALINIINFQELNEDDFIILNQAPVVNLDSDNSGLNSPNFATTFTESGGAVTIVDTDLTITDGDSTELTSATITLTNLLDTGEETLSVTPSGAIGAGDINYNFSTGVLSISALAPLADYQNVLSSLSYDNTSNLPNESDRLIEIIVTDDDGSSSTVVTSTVSVLAVNDPPSITPPSYTGNANLTLTVADGTGDLLDGAVDPEGTVVIIIPDTVTSAAAMATATTADDNNVIINGDGSFTYNPVAGFVGDDTFVYQLQDSAPSPATANITATITLNDLDGAGANDDILWFIDEDATGSADLGTQSDPFTSLASFNSGTTGVGDFIFIDEDTNDNNGDGSNIYDGGITLLDGQTLIGSGSSSDLVSLTGITLGSLNSLPTFSGNAPIISNTAGDGISLGLDNTIRGVTIGDTSGVGITGTNIGTLTLSETTINGTGRILDLNTGTVNANFVSLSTTGTNNQTAIALTNLAGTFNVNSTTNINNSLTTVGNGIDINGGNASYSFAGVNITNTTGTGINLSNTSGTITFDTGSSIQNTAGTAFNVNSSNSTVTYNGTISQNNSASAVSLNNNTGGAIDFNGSIIANTSTATAINLTNNTGVSVNFDGGLNIDTTTGIGLLATGGGTVNVTATGGDESINSTNGKAIDIDNVTTGISFDSISSVNSTSQGIDLTNLGAGSSFTVTGTTTITNAANNNLFTNGALNINTVGNGSTISFGATNINNRNGTGIFLDNVNNNSTTVSFGATAIANPNNAFGYGIRVEDSSASFTFASANISNTRQSVATTDAGSDGVPDNEGDGDAILINNVTGSFTLNGGTLQNLVTDGIDIRNSSNLTVANVTIDEIDVNNTSGNVNPTNDNGIFALNLSGTNLIIDSVISDFDTNGVVGDDDSGIKILNIGTSFSEIRVSNVDFINPGTSLGGNRGFEFTSRGTVNGTIVIEDSDFRRLAGDGIGIGHGNSNGSGTLNVAINNSTFDNTPTGGGVALAGSFGGIQMGVIGTAILNANIHNVTLNNLYPSNANNGMLGATVQEDGTLNIKITDSDFFNSDSGDPANSGGRSGIFITAGNSGISTDDVDGLDITIENNRFSNIDDDGILIDVRGFALNNGATGNIRITNNQIGDDGASGLQPVGQGGFEIGVTLRFRNEPKTINLLFDDNRVRNNDNSTGDETLDLDVEDNAVVNATITNNIFTSVNGTQTADVDITTEDAGSVLNLDLRNNQVSRNNGTSNNGIIRLNEIAGTILVEGAGTAVVTAGDITSSNTIGSAIISGTPTFNNNTDVTLPPASLLAVNNSISQATTVNTALSNLQTRLLNPDGTPAVGVMVTFTAPGVGASGLFGNGLTSITVMTDINGIATASFTANGITGAYQVMASFGGITESFFLLNRD